MPEVLFPCQGIPQVLFHMSVKFYFLAFGWQFLIVAVVFSPLTLILILRSLTSSANNEETGILPDQGWVCVRMFVSMLVTLISR